MFNFWFILSIILVTSASESDNDVSTNNELELLKFKWDLDDIGSVVEKFLVDVADEIVKRIPDIDNSKTTIKPTIESTTENPTSTTIQQSSPITENVILKGIPLEATTISLKNILENINKSIVDISENTKKSQNAATKIILNTINKANRILQNKEPLEVTTTSWKKLIEDVAKNITETIVQTRHKRSIENDNNKTNNELPTTTESKMLKFKTDLDTIQSSIEQLIYDLIDEAIKYIPNSEYIKNTINQTKQTFSKTQLNEGNSITKEFPYENTSTSRKSTKKYIKKNRQENYNRLKPTENAAAIVLDTLAKTQLKDYIKYNLTNRDKPVDKTLWKKWLETVNKNKSAILYKPRSRRSVDSGPTLINLPLTDNSEDFNTTISIRPTDNTECNKKSQNEELMERKHIEDLKEEVNKLHELVALLRAQQKTMSILDKESQNIDDEHPSRYNSKDLLKILEHLNNNEIDNKNMKPIENTDITENKELKIDEVNDISNDSNINISTHLELKKIKTDLRNAIVALNRTKEILAISREREFLLETELKRQQNELNLLRTLMEKLFRNKQTFPPEQILGRPLHMRRTSVPEARNNRSRESNHEYRPKIHKTQQLPKSRASALEELLKDSTKSNIATQLKQLQNEMEKDKRKKLLEALMNQDKESKSFNSLDADDSDFIKKLELALKEANEPQSKSDDNVERELTKLQESISKLRPRDDLDLNTASGSLQLSEEEKINILLKRLNEVNSRNLESKSLQNLQQLTPSQIFALKNKIDQLAESMGGNKNMYSANAGISSSSYDFRKGPMPYSNMAGGFKNPVPVTTFKNQPYPASDGSNYAFDKSRIYGSPYSSDNIYNAYSLPYSANIAVNSGYSTRFPSNYGAINNAFANKAYSMYNGYALSGDRRKDFAIQPMNSRPYFDSPKPLPYSLAPTINQVYPLISQGYSQNDQRSQFFRDTQPIVYDPPIPNDSYPEENVNAGDPSEPAAYPAESPGDANYKTRSIDNLKSQVYSLQNIINSYSYPGYIQKPEDQQIVANLEAQINRLEGIINTMSQDPATNPSYNQNPVTYDQTNLPSPNYENSGSERSASNKEHLINKRSTDVGSNLFDQITSKLRDIIFQDQSPEQISAFSDIQDRVAKLKNQLEYNTRAIHTGRERSAEPYQYSNSYQTPYYQYNNFPSYPFKVKFDLKPKKENTILAAIIVKIIEKIVDITPTIVGKLFGNSLFHLANFDDDNNYSNGYYNTYSTKYNSGNEMYKLFKGFGVFGIFPLIILRIIDGFTTFINILKRNKFFRTFLMPALLLLLVAGSVIFLIWWLQPSDNYLKYKESAYYPVINNNNYDRSSNNYGSNHGYLSYIPKDSYKYKNQNSRYDSDRNPIQGYSRKYTDRGQWLGNLD